MTNKRGNMQAALLKQARGTELEHTSPRSHLGMPAPERNRSSVVLGRSLIITPEIKRSTPPVRIGSYCRTEAQFPAAEAYYATALHELVYWSGHASRLDRQLGKRFELSAYAMEELFAELGSAFLSAHCRLDGVLEHASYHELMAGHLANVLAGDLPSGGKSPECCGFPVRQGRSTA